MDSKMATMPVSKLMIKMTFSVSILLTFGVSLLVGFMVAGKNKKIDMTEALKGTE